MGYIFKAKDGRPLTRPISYPATDEQVYNQLKSLADDGLITVSAGGGKSSGITISGMPKFYVNGDLTGISKENPKNATFVFEYGNVIKTGTVNIKWQGTSSLMYPKKNYTIKLFYDKKRKNKCKLNFNGWGEQNKFCLKANYIDHSHARNIVSAKLWGDIVATRKNTAPTKLGEAPNFGAIDGFFIQMYINGDYQGLYTWNIPKDGWMFNMDKEDGTESVLCGENFYSGCFVEPPVIDGSDWSLEYPDDLSPEISASWKNAIQFVIAADDTIFTRDVENYFDLQSLIDYYIFAVVSCGIDSMGKNQLFVTYDNGKTWVASMYDMDSTWGLYWDGGHFIPATSVCQDDYESMNSGMGHPADGNRLYNLLVANFWGEICARYTELRASVFDADYIKLRFNNFWQYTTDAMFAEDVVINPYIPQKNVDFKSQIEDFIDDRLDYTDSFFVEGE